MTLEDLSKLVHYATPDEFTSNYLEERVKYLLIFICKTVFNDNNFETPRFDNTATAKLIDDAKVTDVLRPFLNKISEGYVKTAQICASFIRRENQAEENNISHAYPKDLEFRTLPELIADYKSVKMQDFQVPYYLN